jgi:photosystem II stability/assembly factor-like uncharacterized protein
MGPRIRDVLSPLFVLLGLLHASALFGQTTQTIPIAEEFDSLHFRSIGPATMSGRIADLAVYEKDPAVYYVGTAHGGLWKTTSNGALFTPQFQNEGLISIGDVTISQRNPEVVWVGAGEANNRQSTSWGGGVWKSTDGGTTFQHMGLENSRHINRIVIDPNNDEIVLVAATGPLFGAGGDRGIFKTTDGGATWTQVLSVDDDTGANDLVRVTTEPGTLYASTYQRRRNACCMNGGGPGSGIWRSTDGGDTWTRLTGNGLPDGPLGRIALDVYRQDGNTVYALIEGPRLQAGGGRPGQAAGADTAAAGGREGSAPESITGVYRSDDGGQSWTFKSRTNPRPMYFSQIVVDPTNPDRVYLGGVGLHMTIDGGATFVTDAARTTHDDIHAIWINPDNPAHILTGNDGGLAVSYDMSKTWTFIPNLPVGLFYHVSFDMDVPYNICGGMQDNYNWCGPSASRHRSGIMNYDWFQIQGGDGFVAVPDRRDSRIVYTESQGGNMIRRNKVTGESKSIRPTATNVTNAEEGDSYRFSWDTPMILSPHDPGVLLAAAQRVFRSTDRGDSWKAVSPDLTTNTDRDEIVTMGVRNDEIRISRNDGISNWGTIVSLAESPAKAGVYYTGTDDGVVSVSLNGGVMWRDITANLPGFPDSGWISEVVPSWAEAGRVYVTVDNHLNNDYEPYIWVSEDFGATFRSIHSGLAGQNVRTLTEDHRNPDVLYIGTETGVFLSLDRGQSWRRLRANLPTVRVDEITLHPRDNAMLVATHGRSLFVLDHLEPIQEFRAARGTPADATLFSIPTALQSKPKDDRNEEFWGHQFFVGENPPTEAVIQFYLNGSVDEASLRISDARGKTIREVTAPESRREPGIRTLCWDMRHEPIEAPRSAAGPGGGTGSGRGGGGSAEIPGVPTPLAPAGYLPVDPCDLSGEQGSGGGFGGGGGGANAGPFVTPGTYNVALLVNGTTVDTKPITIIMDPAVDLAGVERVAYDEMLLSLHELQGRGNEMAGVLDGVYAQVVDISGTIDDMEDVPAEVKEDFTSFQEAFDELRVKFGVPIPAGGGGRRGFGRRGGGDPANVLARIGSLKSSISSFWEAPSHALVNQFYEAGPLLATAMGEAEESLEWARALAATLGEYDMTLTVPPAGG